MKLLNLLLAAVPASQAQKAPPEVEGTVSYAQGPYVPNDCGETYLPETNRVAYVADAIWKDGAACGKFYYLKCREGVKPSNKHACASTDTTYYVMAIGHCVNCKTDFVVSTDVYERMSKRPNAILKVGWTKQQ
jgi:hypothetical protein